MKCSKCGFENTANSSYCSRCGEPIEGNDFDMVEETPQQEGVSSESDDMFDTIPDSGNYNGSSQSAEYSDFDVYGDSNSNVKRSNNAGVTALGVAVIIFKIIRVLFALVVPLVIIGVIIGAFFFIKDKAESGEIIDTDSYYEGYDNYTDSMQDDYTSSEPDYLSVGESAVLYDSDGNPIGSMIVTDAKLVPDVGSNGDTETVLEVDYSVTSDDEDTMLFYGSGYVEAYDELGNYMFEPSIYSSYYTPTAGGYVQGKATAKGVGYFEVEDDTNIVDITYWSGTNCVWRIDLSENI